MRRPGAARGSPASRLLLAAGLLAGLACGWRPGGEKVERPPPPADLDAIGRLGQEYLDAYGEGDAERVAALFTEDGVLVPYDGATCSGRDQIADYFDDLLRDEPATAGFEVLETKVMDGWAFERIDVTLNWSDPSTGEETETWERYFWVLRHQPDGTWRIARMIVSSEEPGDVEDEDRGDGRRT